MKFQRAMRLKKRLNGRGMQRNDSIKKRNNRAKRARSRVLVKDELFSLINR